MATGKLSPDELKQWIFPYLGTRRKETRLGPLVGEDCAALDLHGDLVVLSTDPITNAEVESGYLSVLVSCNDVLSNGAEPVAILLTILLAEDETPETAQQIMASAHRGAKEMNVEIVGGHTETTPGLTQNIISVTAIGRATKSQLLRSDGVREHDGLILTKGAGIEGTAILCADYPDAMKSILSEKEYQEGLKMMEWISIRQEALLVRDFEIHAMHDVTEGGTLGACYELAQASSLGLTLQADQIFIPASTRKICEALDLDPLRLISSGSLLIATPDEQNVVRHLQEHGIPAFVIGRFENKELRMQRNGQWQDIPVPSGDELIQAISRLRG